MSLRRVTFFAMDFRRSFPCGRTDIIVSDTLIAAETKGLGLSTKFHYVHVEERICERDTRTVAGRWLSLRKAITVLSQLGSLNGK
jgi:hypothetical protein